LHSLMSLVAYFSVIRHDLYTSGVSKFGKSSMNTLLPHLDISTKYMWPLCLSSYIWWKFLYSTCLCWIMPISLYPTFMGGGRLVATKLKFFCYYAGAMPL
jgi:hypothetical protein